MSATAATAPEERGIRYWMERVMVERQRVGAEFAVDPVHDLRVALRRCRAIAEGMRTVDPDPRWRRMRRAAKVLFSSLGELRDVQVLEEWAQSLGKDGDPVKARLLAYFATREAELKVHAAEVLAEFDVERWQRWAGVLDGRLREHAIDTQVFEVVALEKLVAASELRKTAARTRSKTALHGVRIGLKRLRYVVENFLAEHHERWRGDLKLLQDVLGEVHDLDVLWVTALKMRCFASVEDRERWREAITQARGERVAIYKSRLGGRDSLLRKWRDELPAGDELREAIAKKFQTWAGFLDADPAHSARVEQSSVALYDRLLALDVVKDVTLDEVSARELLRTAAMTRAVGGCDGKMDRERAARRIERLGVPTGWQAEHVRMIGYIVRCQSGRPPFEEPLFRRMAQRKQRVVILLGGILRLAEAVAASAPHVQVDLEREKGFLLLRAEGCSRPEKLAAASYVLETALGMPIMVNSPMPARRAAAGGVRARVAKARSTKPRPRK